MAIKQIQTPHAQHSLRAPQWRKVRDAIEGEDCVKLAGATYLSKPGAMTDQQYAAYKERASYYAIAERTLRGMSGLVFRNPLQITLPPRLEPLIDVATNDGHSLDVFTETIINELLSVGRYGLLLDFPTDTSDSTALPYVSTYEAEDIINWEQIFVDGRKVVSRVVLRDDADSIGDDNIVQYLELFLNDEGNYEVRKWRAALDENGITSSNFTPYDKTTVPMVKGKPLRSIPFVFINAYDLKPDVAKPPMLDLVNLSLAHYRNSADFEHALYLTAQPTAWISGNISETSKPKSIGSGTIWTLPDGGQCGMLEFTGAGISAQASAMDKKEDRMATLGARMIHDGRQRNEASDTARMRGRAELSLLTNVVNMAQAGLECLFNIAAEWVGSTPESVEIVINRDWIETRLDSNELTALMKAYQSGSISYATFWHNLQQGEIAPLDRTWEDERDMIDDDDVLAQPIPATPAEPAVPDN